MSSILAANCEQNYYFILVPVGLVLDGVRCDCFLRRYPISVKCFGGLCFVAEKFRHQENNNQNLKSTKVNALSFDS